jgi:DNA repair exonuclease SbcCD ATPase subunit
MIIEEIAIKNFKSFGNSEQILKINKDKGELILLMGNNGNGKSSLINSLDFSLFGKCKGNKKKWATLANLPNRINGGDLSVKIKFRSGDNEIEVSRGIAPNFLKLVENGNENERAGKANLDEKIEKYVGMDIETFKSFISLSINDFKNFISLSNEEKQILLDKLFNLEVINILNNILKDLNKANKLQLTKFDSEISTLNESIESIKRSIQKAIEQEKQNLQSEIDEIKSLMESRKDEYSSLKEKMEKIKVKESELKSEMERERERFINIGNEIRNVQREIDLYNSGKCPTCKTDFNNDHYNGLLELLNSKKIGFESIKNEIEISITGLKEKQSKLISITDSTTKSFNDLNYLLKNYKLQIDKLVSQKGLENKQLPNLVEFENTIKELELKKSVSDENSNVCKEKEVYYKELSKIFGEDGVKKNIIAGIIKPINYFINDNISKMNLPFRVELDETFTANIKQFGTPIEHDSLSTGETKLINISILIAYLMLIRTKRTINVLFLDEVFSSIDIENIEKILNLLKSFAAEYKINIFVVHHALMNEGLFDRIIKIDKNIFSEIKELNFEEIEKNNFEYEIG